MGAKQGAKRARPGYQTSAICCCKFDERCITIFKRLLATSAGRLQAGGFQPLPIQADDADRALELCSESHAEVGGRAEVCPEALGNTEKKVGAVEAGDKHQQHFMNDTAASGQAMTQE